MAPDRSCLSRKLVPLALACVVPLALAAPAGASATAVASKAKKCKPNEAEQQRFLGGLDFRVNRISCAKARRTIVRNENDLSGYGSNGSKGCSRSPIEPRRKCKFRLSGFKCVSKTNRRLRVKLNCTNKRKHQKAQKVKLRFLTGVG